MLTNADITVYNAYFDADSREDRYVRTVIRGVWFYVDNKAAVTPEGLNAADVFKVRIPTDADTGGSVYVPPEQFTGQNGTWTLQHDDYVVRGVSELEIDAPAELRKQKLQAFKITSWADNRFGFLRHWRIGGA